LRLRLRSHLSELIDRIEVFSTGFQKRYDVDEQERVLENIPKKKRRRAHAEYVDSVEHFAEIIDDLCEHCLPDGTPRKPLHWEDGKLRMTNEEKTFYAFLEHITQRRMTKEARFLRVHYKTGARIDLVPEGSLASGMKLVKDGRRNSGWRFLSPKLDGIWREYIGKKGRKQVKG